MVTLKKFIVTDWWFVFTDSLPETSRIIIEGGGAKMYAGRSRQRGQSISGHPSSSENLGCEIVAGCCETLQHRHGYHGSLITLPPGSGWPLLHNSMHLRSFSANLRVFYPNRAPSGGAPLVLLRSHWFQTVWQEPPWLRSGMSPDTVAAAASTPSSTRQPSPVQRTMGKEIATASTHTDAWITRLHRSHRQPPRLRWECIMVEMCHYSTLCEPPSLEGSDQSGWVDGIQNNFHHCWGNRSWGLRGRAGAPSPKRGPLVSPAE